MKIHFFTKPSDYDLLFKVGITADDGNRHICVLWEQAGRHYVRTANFIEGERKRYDFTDQQEAELLDFIASPETNREYFDSPLI